MAAKVDQLRESLGRIGQDHLLRFWEELSPDRQEELAADIERTDFEQIRDAFETSAQEQGPVSPGALQVPAAMPAHPTPELEQSYAEARKLGERTIRDGRVAAMVVAGGQGTRLGFDGPKGAFPIGPVSGKCLFQIFAESILATNDRYGCRVPWYVMTSAANHDPTVRLFEDAEWFGLERGDVVFFQQEMVPIVDRQGRVLLADKHRIARAPNGHGGSLAALATTGCLSDMARRGVDAISYFQVDNPLVRPVDPLFVGLHALKQSEASSLTIGKASDDEKVGLFVEVDGTLRVVEYTVFPDELKALKTAAGERQYDQANIAVHCFDRAFIERIVGGGRQVSLPWHRAVKKVEHVDLETGAHIQPDEPNAVKTELFVFDALPLARRTLLLEAPRGEVFSPVKNADGADSIETARRDMVRRAGRWLEGCGVHVPRLPDGTPDAVIEISPLYALDAEALTEKESGSRRIERGAALLLE